MSLATLNKQRTTDKQQSQSIKTTVTISKVSKTPVQTPNLSESKKFVSGLSLEPSTTSSDSPITVREASITPDDIPYADEMYNQKQAVKERFMNEGGEIYRRGKLMIITYTF